MESKKSESDKPDKPEKPSPEKKPPLSGGNLIWYLLALGVGTIFLASLWTTDAQVAIPYGELGRLIEMGTPDENPEAAIEISVGQKAKRQRIRFSNLADLKFGPSEITGRITMEVLEPKEKRADPVAEIVFHTAIEGLEISANDLADKAIANGFSDVRGEAAPGFWRLYSSMMIFPLLLIFFFLFMMRRMGGPGSAMAFGRSRGKLWVEEEMGVSFDDVAGIDEALDELREVVDFLAKPDKYRALGGRIPRGVLLVGPPGTGKTLLAKAVAGEADVPFYSISGSDFVEMFVGVGAARVRDMFQQAQAKSPCIVFIDELDALGKTRGSSIVGGHDEREQTLNALLVEMDGFSSNNGVIVMAATNRPETLDPALLRPGRFDRHVLVDRPDIRGREDILKVHIKNIKLDESIDIKKIAGITSGFVGADLANLVNEAALLAAREGKSAVTMLEFTEGVERVTTGLEKRQRIIHEDEKQRVAYHESAHALVAYSLPNTDPVHKVSIIPRGLAALGYTMQRPEGDRYLMTQIELESRVQVLLAGTMAEEMIFDDISTGAQNDLERATEIARSMVMDFGMSRLGRVNYRESGRSVFFGGPEDMPRERTHSEHTAREIDEEIKHIITQSQEKAHDILEARRDALLALAECLIEKEAIDGEQLKEIIEKASPSPKIVPGTASVLKRPSSEHREPGEGEAGKASG